MSDKTEVKKAGPDTVLVEYKGANFHTFQFPGKEIRNKFVAGSKYRMFPGINKMTLLEWNTLKDHIGMKHLVGSGKLVFLGGVPGEAGSKAFDLSGYEPKQAVSMVLKTGNMDLLNEWLMLEKRPGVAEAIRNQIAEIGPVTNKEQKAANDE